MAHDSPSSGGGSRPRVIIVGGGFAGLNAAKALGGHPVRVTLIDRRNHHTFQPLLYQVATAVLSPGEIAEPIRRVLRRLPNVQVVLGEVTGIDTGARSIALRDGVTLPFDYLIVAAGARHSYFGHDEWERDAPGLKTLEDAVEIRRRILMAFETAERNAWLTGRHDPPRFSVIGGGPTGVEMAGAIADIATRALAGDFKALDTKQTRITLYEGAPRLLGMFAEELSVKARHQLEELGVEVRTGAMVTAVEPDRIRVGDEWIRSDVTVWATGTAASPLGKALGSPVDRAGRVQVLPDLSIPGHPEIFVAGDMAALTDIAGRAVPALGAAATQGGAFAARNILRDLRGEKRESFRYKDRGTMATIGRHRAVAEIAGRRISGYIAWLLWACVHIFLLVGFRNRLAVFREWAWAYFTRERSARLITGTAPGPGLFNPETWRSDEIDRNKPEEPRENAPE